MPTAGFAGIDSMIVSAGDGIYSTPIRVDVTVATSPPAPAAPAAEALSSEPAPTIAPAACRLAPVVSKPAVASAHGPASYRNGTLSFELACADPATACAGRFALSAMLRGARRSLGSRTATLAPGTTARVAVAISPAGRRLLRSRAGRTIPLRVSWTADGVQRRVTTVSLHIPR